MPTISMYKAVIKVLPLPDYRLLLTFAGGERRVFDVTPYLGKGVFGVLREKSMFDAVRVSFDTITWPNGADLCPELLYAQSQPLQPGVSSQTEDAGRRQIAGRDAR